MKTWLISGLMTLSTALNAYDLKWDQYKQKVLFYQDDKYVRGWCSREKAEKMMDLIFEAQPKVCVEIGVFGGSSIYPQAQALKYLNDGGMVYAIDPWSNAECAIGYNPGDPNYEWWTKINLDHIYKGFVKILDTYEIKPFCTVMRMTSKEAVLQFQDELIDILHVDGNHTEQIALSDVQMFLPKVKKGGYIWFDDVNWSSTNKAVMYLAEYCTFDEARSIGNSCSLFKKN